MNVYIYDLFLCFVTAATTATAINNLCNYCISTLTKTYRQTDTEIQQLRKNLTHLISPKKIKIKQKRDVASQRGKKKTSHLDK